MSTSIAIASISDTFINSACPNANFGNCIVNRVGKKNHYSSNRLLLKFGISAIPKPAIIVSARLKLYIACVQNNSTREYFTPYMIKSNWLDKSVTWNNCPEYDESIYGSSTVIETIGWHEWNVIGIVEKWYSGEFTNNGILIKAREVIDGTCDTIISQNNTNCRYINLRPVLIMEYNSDKHSNNVTLVGRRFDEEILTVSCSEIPSYTLGFDVSQQTLVSFFVKNIGENIAKVFLQVSPDDIDYLDDSSVYEIQPGEIKAIVPKIYSKYVRICYMSLNTSQFTNLNITIQAQV